MSQITEDQYEGYTKEQFETALKAASGKIAARAMKAKAGGMIGTEETARLLSEILDQKDDTAAPRND